MDPNCVTEPPPRQKIPKDGYGPRGFPDVYYTSRTLNSTFRYVRFVSRLRQMEEEVRLGKKDQAKKAVDKQNLDFFVRCDRRGLINNVAHRVELCLEAYEEDLKEKRQRLIELLTAEEKENLRLFAEQMQAGTEAVWQEKQDRLKFLLAKRRKEHEDRFMDTPLSKCTHVWPCIYKLRAKETQEIHLYQMREKQMRKLAELERNKMWHDVAMKESEALAVRMEMDVIERHRRDLECKKYTDLHLAARKQEREREREQLKQEAILMKAKWHEDELKEAEAERQREERRHEMAKDMKEMIEERKELVARQKADAKLINDTWDSLAGQGLADEKAKEDRRRQIEMDLDECNRKMVALKQRIAEVKVNNEPLIEAERRRRQDAADLKRCQYRKWAHDMHLQNTAKIKEQMKEKEAEQEKQRAREAQEQECRRQMDEQLEQLVKHRQLTDAQARRLYQRDLREQADYNKKLKEKAKQEALLEAEKCKIATQQYQQEIANMLSRPFFSDGIHPFMKQMASGLKMREKCKCSLPSYCLDTPGTKTTVAVNKK